MDFLRKKKPGKKSPEEVIYLLTGFFWGLFFASSFLGIYFRGIFPVSFMFRKFLLQEKTQDKLMVIKSL